jgi:hypothetical protein
MFYSIINGMGKASEIVGLTKDKNTHFGIRMNKGLKQLFTKACKQEKKKPSEMVTKLILDYLEGTGRLNHTRKP